METTKPSLPDLHPGDPVQSIGVKLEVVRQTEKAIQVQAIGSIDYPKVWLPKSQASIVASNYPKPGKMIRLPAWLYRKVRPQLLGDQS